MPWRIEAGGNIYNIKVGEDVTVSAPDIHRTERINLSAVRHIDSEVLNVAEVYEDGHIDKGSEQYIYSTVNNLKSELAKRGVKVEFV